MAVFKPTNCSPYLTSFDITYLEEGPIYFQCKIDTSNTKIDGYAITVYDNDNNQVFPHSGNAVDNISYIKDLYQDTTRMGSIISDDGISDLNTGLNGSYLKIPFVVDSDDFDNKLTETTKKNVVVYNKELDGSYKIKDSSGNIIELYNGNQYKWTITLYQLGQSAVDKNKSRPEDIKYYDMTVASGKILGSTNERIQSYPSDQIYNDYFIQLYDAQVVNVGSDFQIAAKITGDVKQVGTRVRIKDYDSYLGHMYLQTGQDGLSEENLKTSNVFQVFKMSNNPDDLGIKDKVDFCINKNYFVPKFFQNSESDASAAYLNQTFVIVNVTGSSDSETLKNVRNVYNQPFFKNTGTFYGFFPHQYCSKNFSDYDKDKSPTVIFGQSRVLLNTENDKNELNANGTIVDSISYTPNEKGLSLYNGIWIPKTPTVEKIIERKNDKGEYTGADYKITIQWYRSSDADTWGEITNKVVLDTNNFNSDYDQFAGQNIQAYTSAQEGEQVTTGTINKMPIKFKLEEPVEIYPNNSNEHNYGLIYKNNMQLTSVTGYINFISPSVAVSVGDKIFNKDNSSSNIIFLDKTVWAIGQNSILNFKTNDLYSIKTFFRSSSENQFSLYERPTVDLKLQGVSGGEPIKIENDMYEVKERSIFAQATYNQTNLVQWRNYQWFLYDVPNVYKNDETGKNEYKTAAQSALTTYLNPNNLILQSEVGYDKEIKYTFYGLAEVNHWYIISLVLTDQYGTIITKRVAVYTGFTVNLEKDKDWVNYGLRCDLTGVDMWFEDKYGYIYPNLGDRNYLIETDNNYKDNPTGVEYSDNAMSITDTSEGVLYDSVYSNDGLSSWNSPSKQNLTFNQSNGIEFTMEITIDTYQYSAEFLNVVINTDGGQIKNLVLKPEDLYISFDRWPEGYKVGFPNYECYKIVAYPIDKYPNIYAIGTNSKIYDYGNATTDLFPSSYKNYIENNNYYISYIPSNVVPLGANKLDRNNEDHWYFIDYDEENSVKDIISDEPIKINKQILDLNDPNVPEGLNKKDVFYNFPIFIRNDLSLSGKTIGNLPAGTKVYSLWMDKNDEIIIPTIVAINESADTVYYCYRKVKNKNTKDHVNIKDNTWEDKNGDNDNVWEDEITAEYTQSEHLRKQDDSLEDPSKYPLNTIKNRLYNKTLNFYVRWRVSENDNITYEIDGDVSQDTTNVDSELSLTSVTGEGENG